MSENHYEEDSCYFFGNRQICFFDTIEECVKNSDIIIISKEHKIKFRKFTDKRIIVIDLNDESLSKYFHFSLPNLDYKGKPVIAILSLGEYNDQYNTEIMVNKILKEKNARIAQVFSRKTQIILDSYFQNDCLNNAISTSVEECYDIICISIEGINNYQELLRIMYDISPDMILVCVNKLYDQEKELSECLFAYGGIDLVISSPYIPYEIVKGKVHPVFCGYDYTSRYCESFQNNLYDTLKKTILKCIYYPEKIIIL